MLHNGIYTGWVRHRRLLPRRHQFRYPFAMVALDLDAINTVFKSNLLWSVERFNVLSLHRKDCLQSRERDLKQAIYRVILENTGKAFSGSVRLVTVLRTFGFYFNSVSFYFCYENDQLVFVVSEINNTPWNERYAYVMDAETSEQRGLAHHFHFNKQFHVSPFMPMNLRYHWTFLVKDTQLAVNMNLYDAQVDKYFDATMNLSHTPFSVKNMTLFPLIYPLQGAMMLSRIYMQALRVWLKRIPFFNHPDTHFPSADASAKPYYRETEK